MRLQLVNLLQRRQSLLQQTRHVQRLVLRQVRQQKQVRRLQRVEHQLGRRLQVRIALQTHRKAIVLLRHRTQVVRIHHGEVLHVVLNKLHKDHRQARHVVATAQVLHIQASMVKFQ